MPAPADASAAPAPVLATDTGAAPSPAPPPGCRLTRPYGFRDEFGDAWFWNAGTVVRNPYVVGLLATREAPVEELEG